MKKFIVFLLVCLCTCPSFAQSGKGLKAWLQSLRCRREVAQTVIKASPTQTVEPLLASAAAAGLQLVRIDNLFDNPLVPVRMTSQPIQSGPLLSARVVPPDQAYEFINVQERTKLRVPGELAQRDGAIYRGLRLTSLKDLQHILEKGMEIEKSHFSEIYASYSLNAALGYALFPEEIPLGLPVLVKIPVTIHLLEKNTPCERDYGDVTFQQDLWPELMSNVMILLEIDGKMGWYEAKLEDGKLVLTPAVIQTVSGTVGSPNERH